MVEELKSLPGPIEIPIIGSVFSMGDNPGKTLLEWSKEYYGPVFQVKLGGLNVLVLQGYEAIHEALVLKGEDFAGRVENTLFRNMRNNNGLFFAQYGQRWEIWRKFAASGLHAINSHINKSIAEEAGHFLTFLNAVSNAEKPVNMEHPVLFTMANGVMQTCFSRRFQNIQDPEFQKLLTEIYTTAGSPKFATLTFFPWLGYFPPFKGFLEEAVILRKRIIGELTKLIQEHKYDEDKNDLTNLLYKDDPTPDIKKIKSFAFLVEDLIFGGSSTTRNEFLWGILFLTRHPEKVKKLQKELDLCLEEDDAVESAIQSNFDGFNYLKAVVEEVKRIRPIAPTSMPRQTLKETSLMGFKVPKNMMVMPNIWGTQHDSSVFPEPDKFKPERFINEDDEFEASKSVIPFGMGLRKCVGYNVVNLELRTYFLTLFYNFNVKLVTKLSDKDMEGIVLQTLQPPQFEIELTKRR